LRFIEETWSSEKLGNLCKITMGQSPSSKNYSKNSNDTILIQGNADLISGKIVPRIYTSEITKLSYPGDIILTVRAPVGDLAINEFDSCIGRGVCSIKGNKFIYYYLESLKDKHVWERLSQGSTFESINSNDIKNLNLKIPSNSTQNHIINFFTAIDTKIELLQKKHGEYIRFKQYLMQNIFADKSAEKLRFVDFNNSSWKDYKFKDLGTVKSGVGFSNKYQGHLDLDYNFYKVSDMNLKGNEKVMTRSNNTIDDNLLKDIGVKLIENPSIIFAKVGEAIFLNRKRIAKQPFLIDNNMMAFSPNENVDLEFMYYLATSINFGKYAQTGALPSYNASDIYSIKCKIPPIEEQKRIGKLLSLADNKIDFCSNQLNKTQEFKKGLLQQMFVVRINWRCNFKLAKSPSFNKHLLILKNKIIFIIIE